LKIKTQTLSYDEVLKLPIEKHKKPKKPNMFFRTLLKIAGSADLKATHFTCQKEKMEKLGSNEPALFLMNHSSFIDLKIASSILYPRPFNIVCTSDGFVGKKGLMRSLGCIPTKKFVMDTTLVKDMVYAVKTLKSSVLMYPEASYSFDGTATTLPDSLGKLLKLLKVPVVMIQTEGAFLRDPLYNMLKLRQVDVKATMKYLLSPDEIKEKTVEELNEILKKEFTFDNFRFQQEHHISVSEDFRADGLERVLYKCPSCQTEGQMEGSHTKIRCKHCQKTWELTEYGFLKAEDGNDIFHHVPDWYAWERSCVKKEIEDGTYTLDIPVEIGMLVDLECLNMIGEGRLTHTKEGFHLVNADGHLDYKQVPLASYSLYSDYFWYEIGDVISIGDTKALYYCFPKEIGVPVAKTRLAAEELYKMQTLSSNRR